MGFIMTLMDKLWKASLPLVFAASSLFPSKDLNAQGNSFSVLDSSIVKKTVTYDFHLYDEVTLEGVDGAAELGAMFSPEPYYKDDPTYYDFTNEFFYDGGVQPKMDSEGNFSGSASFYVFDQISTGVRNKEPLVPSDFGLGAYPNPYNPETNVLFSVKKKGSYVCQLVDLDGSLIFDRTAELYPGSYQVNVSGGSAGVDFFRLIGPDGGMQAIKLLNLGGGSVPSIGSISGSNYVGGSSSVDGVLFKDGLGSVSSDTFEKVVDSLEVGWGKNPTYWAGNSMQKIPLYGVLGGKDTLVNRVTFTQTGEPIFTFVTYHPGDGVDTVAQHFNMGKPSDFPDGFVADSSNFYGRVLLFYSERGRAADSLSFLLPLKPK
jgi:hypothetical protein